MFEDVFPTVETDALMAADFLAWWHPPGSLVNVYGLKGGEGYGFSFLRTVDEHLGTILDHGLEGVVHGTFLGERSRSLGMYHVLGAFSGPLRSRHAHGTNKDIIRSHGWAVDLDVKPGSFESEESAKSFVWDVLDHTPLRPHACIATGSGGQHLYQRVHGGLEPAMAREMTLRTILWIEAETGVGVDHLTDPVRMMRVPGSVRWPKVDENRKAARVYTWRLDDAWVDLEEVRAFTQRVWDGELERRKRRKDEWDARVQEATSAISDMAADLVDAGLLRSGKRDWAAEYLLAMSETAFNAEVSWARILDPLGWSPYGMPDAEGRQQWTRPGAGAKNPRSAVTDWRGSPHVMSLLSSSPETGLAHLYNDGIGAGHRVALTKLRVSAELLFGGSVREVLTQFLTRKAEARR